MVLWEASLKPKQIRPFANQLSITFAMKLPASLQKDLKAAETKISKVNLDTFNK